MFKNKIYNYIIILIIILVLLYIFNKNEKNENFDNINKRYKIAVITSVFGDYDNLKYLNHIKNKNLFDWYCFTDNNEAKNKNKGWIIINSTDHIDKVKNNENFKKLKNYYIDKNDKRLINMMSAKYYKAQIHNIDILKKYDYFVWIDTSLKPSKNFVNLINNIIYKKDNIELIHMNHDERNNIQDEVKVAGPMEKYKTQNLNEQLKIYKEKFKFKDDQGLMGMRFFIYKNTKPLNKLFDDWWYHNLKFSYQDQISYPFLLWKNNIRPNHIINMNNNLNNFFKFIVYKGHTINK